jgi:multicomponent Na+:H+ antiporter subunit B
MTLIVKTTTRLVLVFITVFSSLTVAYGHLTPGGGFAGGVMLACALILIVLSYGRHRALAIVRNPEIWVFAGSAGIVVYGLILIGFVGGFTIGKWLGIGTPIKLLSGGTVLYSNILIGINVMAILFAVFLELAAFRPRDTEIKE